jgi:riboflavin synthase
MFTGLIEEVGTVRTASAHRFAIRAAATAAKVAVGDSVSVNGVCLTVTDIEGEVFGLDVSAETLRKTTLGRRRPGQGVNLETSLTLQKPLGGHLLLGHVDTAGTVRAVEKAPDSWILMVAYPPEFAPLVVIRGSLGVDGVSLTVAELEPDGARIAVIPHTLDHTVIRGYAPGTPVNLEFDIIGKYVARWLELARGASPGTDPASPASPLTLDRLKDLGY